MKTLLGILPWAVVLAVGGIAIWFLLDQEMAIGPWLLAGILLGHGLVHGLYFVPAPASGPDRPTWPFDLGRSWPVRSLGLGIGLVRAGSLVLFLVVVVAFTLAALATVGILVPADLWGPLVIVGAAASLAMLVVGFDAMLALGIGIDIVLLVVVLGPLWSPATT
ncbi:MAG TPA: hypothetical protein VLA23_03570 [Candidatus Limnocylindrales bacterium]|nr:hypothetical protein [Candidatus Limnocylindrales bacterium]